MKQNLTCLFATLSLAIFSHQANAQNAFDGSPGSDDPPYTVGSGWQSFSWSGSAGVFDSQGAFTFSTASPTQLDVTDIANVGDEFSLFDNGTLIGTTSSVADTGILTSETPDQAFADPQYSHGIFALAPGSHSLTIQTVVEAVGFSVGAADFQVVTVPEPTSLALAGLGGLSLMMFRRQRK
jgi:hypothetical protein